MGFPPLNSPGTRSYIAGHNFQWKNIQPTLLCPTYVVSFDKNWAQQRLFWKELPFHLDFDSYSESKEPWFLQLSGRAMIFKAFWEGLDFLSFLGGPLFLKLFGGPWFIKAFHLGDVKGKEGRPWFLKLILLILRTSESRGGKEEGLGRWRLPLTVEILWSVKICAACTRSSPNAWIKSSFSQYFARYFTTCVKIFHRISDPWIREKNPTHPDLNR